MTDWFVGNLDDPRIRALHWRHGDARVQARQLWFTLERPDHATIYLRDGMITYAPVSGDPRPVPIMPREEIPLEGEHNVQNAMAALLVALAVGCNPESLRRAMRRFEPMPHRLRTVAEIEGVRYIDDSKSTNPGSAIAALRTYDAPIVLIAGGRSKGTDFSALGAEIRQRAAALVTLGEAGPAIARAARGVRSVVAASMDDAVRHASDLASPGSIVLLSPGCASFDMFASAEDRGDRFADAVQALREPAGA
jgi:UDP-N-acetylmuramoylalanine--D-glutamate ligase